MTRPKIPLLAAAVLVSCGALGSADPLVYVYNAVQFGTLDLATGAFHQIGSDLPDGAEGLAPTQNGSLLTLGFSGNLDSINPTTGVQTTVEATGLADCATPSSACGPTSGSTIGTFGGALYALDFQNELYRVNPTTGAATAIGLTGIPAVTAIPLSTNPDGTLNIYDEALFPANGRLYVLFDAGMLNPDTGDITTVVTPALYLINTATGVATRIATTPFGLGAAAEVNGQTYAFSNPLGAIETLDLETGSTTFVTDFDSSAGIISSAAPTPEPASFAIVGAGLLAIGALTRKRAWRVH